MKQLKEIIDVEDERPIASLMLDSRLADENSLFFCIEGLTVDGHDFVEDAIKNGAIAIVHRKPLLHKHDDVYYHQVEDVESVLHQAANAFYDYPSQNMYVYGITGTNGKSTIMKTVKNILLKMGVKAGYIGTISVEYGEHVFEPSLTTPDIVTLNTWLSKMREEGITDVCLEVSSQGLAMRRVDGIDFDLAAFTNLTHDHLDYHKTMENYFEAKKILFDRLDKEKPMFINMDDPYGKRLVNAYSNQAVTYGVDLPADYRAKDVEIHEDYTSYILEHKGIEYEVKTNLLAYFNVYNSLAVIAILHHRGFPIETIISHLEHVPHVEGRLTQVDSGQDYKVYVDFSHTPDGMKKVYEFVRMTMLPNQKLITVFGAAGERDHAKRPVMGQIASEYCDHVILTEHDNRSEDVETITQEIIAGMPNKNYEFIPVRIKAIEKAIYMAEKGDVVVLIGKGEEKFIYRDFGKEPWIGDEVAAEEIIKKKEEE